MEKKSKNSYYNNFFNTHWTNIKNTGEDINSILIIKNELSHIPKLLTSNDTAIANPVEITNLFNNYFTPIAAKTNRNIFSQTLLGLLKQGLGFPFD